jgi:hypothetical protein
MSATRRASLLAVEEAVIRAEAERSEERAARIVELEAEIERLRATQTTCVPRAPSRPAVFSRDYPAWLHQSLQAAYDDFVAERDYINNCAQNPRSQNREYILQWEAKLAARGVELRQESASRL